MKQLSLLSLILVLTIGLTACDPGEGEPDSATLGDSDEETYSVGIDTTFPPFVIEDGDSYKGIDVAIIKAIAEDQGFEVELKPTDFSGLMPALQTGSLDIAISGISITDKRKEIVNFSKPYYTAGLSLVTTKDQLGIKGLVDLKNKPLVVKTGTTGYEYAKEHKDMYNYKITQVTNSEEMYGTVINGEGVAFLGDAPVASYAIKEKDLPLKIVRKKLEEHDYAIAVSKDTGGELLEKINNGLKNLKETGKLDKIIRNYLEKL
ncbi:transporter substrate-binding domain-containing protein [Virgibacillus kekensis]|uniref:Transporter substrate-binding domain-containing protein n=1 Tax=Virgibacillus kekensis TaxID=202261 RepID=A0ABV9DIB7_9BACI